MTRKNLKRRVQKTVATVTHTADNADTIQLLRATIAHINELAIDGRVAIRMADVNNHSIRMNEARRIENMVKLLVRGNNGLKDAGYESLGAIAINKRLPEGYDYRYVPIIRTDGTADEHNAEVWRKAVDHA